MKNLKRIAAFALTLVTALSLTVPGFAAGGIVFADVPAGVWYEDAVRYVADNGFMNGTGSGQFSPDSNTSRAMLVTVLWRMAGEPLVDHLIRFPDVGEDWYTEAVRWALSEHIVDGYSNGLFGANDPVTREQLVTILWRYQGRPSAESGEDFADEAEISEYAAEAVDWARENGVVNGRGGNRFVPRGRASRAETATVLYNLALSEAEPEPQSKILVVCFSATGSTRQVAGYIADALDADLFELVPVRPYTSDDLSWTDPDSRASQEHEDEALRNVELVKNTVENWADYDTVFIGYPIWWGIAAWPVNDFIRSNDFSGKTVIPFCTSASSGLGQSGELLAGMAGSGSWQEGQRFPSGVSREQVANWVEGLELNRQ